MGNWKTRECWNRNGNAKSDVANLIFGPGMMATENVEKVEISKDDGFSDPMLFQLMPCSDTFGSIQVLACERLPYTYCICNCTLSECF